MLPLQLQSLCPEAEGHEADKDGTGAGSSLRPKCCPLSRHPAGELADGAAHAGFLCDLLPLHLPQLCQQQH